MADYRIITISRQFGSGGRTIGKKLAEKLGIPCYDQEIIAAVAKESGFSKDYIAEHGDDVNTTWMGNIFHMGGSLSNQDVMWVAQSNVVRELAAKGPCVIVGRCADYILRDDYKLLKVFVFADVKARQPLPFLHSLLASHATTRQSAATTAASHQKALRRVLSHHVSWRSTSTGTFSLCSRTTATVSVRRRSR